MSSTGQNIYLGFTPILKTVLTILVGFVLAKTGNFPRAASRGSGKLILNVALPALIFANVVPAFNSSNISSLGPLIVAAIFYQIVGCIFGFIIREVTYVPKDFQAGIVVATALSNWGNLPNAIIVSVTSHSPFNPASDPALGVSYVAIFIVIFQLTFFAGGAANTIAWDYASGVPHGEAAEVKTAWRDKASGKFVIWLSNFHIPPLLSSKSSAANLTEKSISEYPRDQISGTQSLAELPTMVNSSRTSITQTRRGKLLAILKSLFQHLTTPVTSILFLALVIALVNPLKAIFTKTDGYTYTAPDGKPPLSFIIDTAALIGALAIPLALIILGANFASMKIPRPLKRLPWSAMIAVTVAKMIVLPVIGIIFVEALVKRGWIKEDQIVLRFCLMFLSGTPTAVNQLVLTQTYCGDEGQTDTLVSFLLVQYAVMIVLSSALAAICISLLR